MSFLKSLFGGGKADADQSAPKAAAEEDYKGFLIQATPTPVGSEHQLCGAISKDIGGVRKTYEFVRADRLGSRDEAAAVSLAKGRQLIDEQGEKIFD